MHDTNQAPRTLVIAEAGVNHNGNLDMALDLVDAAAAAGADIVKFQTFRAEALASRHASKASYQAERDAKAESQLSMLKRLELDAAAHEALFARCELRGIEFLSTAFDSESLRFIAGSFPLKRLKLPSGEITNGPFLLEHARLGVPLILSTGMCTLAEIEEALAVIAWGQLNPSGWPKPHEVTRILSNKDAWASLEAQVTLLHCTSLYPTPPCEVNLKAMDTLCHAFGLKVGYSDHTNGIAVPVAAVARGASAIEKHLTLDRCLPGPDHHASLEPDEFRSMVESIRTVEQAIGHGRKVRMPAEEEIARVARKSLVAAQPIAQGTGMAPETLRAIRGESGLSPMNAWRVVGKPATRDYEAGDVIVE